MGVFRPAFALTFLTPGLTVCLCMVDIIALTLRFTKLLGSKPSKHKPLINSSKPLGGDCLDSFLRS